MVDYPTVPIITEHGIDLNELLSQIALPLDGAVAMFAGTVFIACAAPHRDTHVFETALRHRPPEADCPDLEKGNRPERHGVGRRGRSPRSVGNRP